MLRSQSRLPARKLHPAHHTRQYKIEAADNAGFTYSVQTLRQWVQTGPDGEILFQCVDIVDAPRIKWRSFMLDSGRQYQSPATIKKYIDMASLLKMNYFHWHLTEGLGWRVEIKQYPLLTQKGAYAAVGEEQQGFYSQEEIKALVDYAAARNITIVPEIDMPGHAEAALHSYPELGCFNRPVEIPKLGFTPNIFVQGKKIHCNSSKRIRRNMHLVPLVLHPSGRR